MRKSEMKEARTFLYVEGILLIILGVLAIALPAAAATAVAVLAAILLLIAGGVRLVRAIAHRGPGWGWAIAAAVLALVAAILILTDPFAGVVALTVIVGVYFFVEGVTNIIAALRFRRDVVGWGWVIAQGLLGVLVGVLIVLSWPVSATWFIGILVGLNFIFAGISTLVLARAVDRS